MKKRKVELHRDTDLPGEPEIIDEYTNDELNDEPDTGLPLGVEPEFSEGVFTGGAVGESSLAESVILRDSGAEPEAVPGWDSAGQTHCLDPVESGTVAGNTTAAGGSVGMASQWEAEAAEAVETGDEILDEIMNDLGPNGSIVQEVGGEARR